MKTIDEALVDLTDEPQLGILRWVDDQDSTHTHLDLGQWQIGYVFGPTAHDSWHDVHVDPAQVVSFTPCSLVEDEALSRLRNQQGADGLGATTPAALAAFLEHIEVMNR